MATEFIIDATLKFGSISGLVSLIYLVFQSLQKRPRFKLDFQGSSGEHYDNDGVHFFRHSYSGILKNQSLEPNSVTHFYLAVWGNKKKTSTLRFGHGGIKIVDKSDDNEIKLPIHFSPREAKNLHITFEFPVKGTADERLLQEYNEVKQGTGVYLPKHEYEICTQDISENMFDSNGRQINRDEINLRWTLPNTVRELQQGKVFPFIKHSGKIIKSKLFFQSKLLMQGFGLWK